jgi:biotin-(acetyl-CoA carboxylase) ligase
MNLEELKESNNKYLASVGIGVNPNLPIIEELGVESLYCCKFI